MTHISSSKIKEVLKRITFILILFHTYFIYTVKLFLFLIPY